MPRLREFRYTHWATWAMARHLQDAPTIIAVDTETTGLAFHEPAFAATVTWRRPSGELQSAYFDLETDKGGIRAGMLQRILRRTPQWVGHNLKFDLQKLQLAGIITEKDIAEHELHDTQTIYHLLDENSPKALKTLAVSVLKYDDTIEVEVKSGANAGSKKRVPKEEHQLAAARRKLGLKKADGYHLLPRTLLIPYALRDTEFTLRLYETLMPRLEAKGEELLAWYRTEMALVPVALRMEADGMALDLPYLDETTSEYGVRVIEGEAWIRALTGRDDLNPNAPAQLMEAFKARGLDLESTDVATLEPLDDELAENVLAYRSDQKVYKTYLRGLQSEQRDGLFHPNFNLVGPRTGRTSSGSAKE